MFNAEAIKAIQQANATPELGELLSGQLTPLVAVPDNFNVKSLEQYAATRVRARGKFYTNSIKAFSSFVDGFEQKLPVFVSDSKIKACAIFNYEDMQMQGHCDHTAEVELLKTAEFKALLDVNGRTLDQRGLAEFMEDYRDNIVCFGSDGEALDIKKSIAAIRRVTIDKQSETESEQGDFSSSKSRLERHTARSTANVLPAGFRFTCTPYNGLSERSFETRIALRGNDDIELTVKVKLLEKHYEEIAENFADVVEASVGSNVSVYVGSFNP
jgi:uncharacterized protein YfdQ (DUF2303 family)